MSIVTSNPLELEAGIGIDVKPDDEKITFATCVESLRNRSGKEWATTGGRVSLTVFFLYFFLVFLDLMGSAFKIIGGCQAGEMLEGLSNPIAGLMVGVISTVLVQSSSTTTSIIVSLVGSDAMSVRVAIPVVMGANIGTSVTSTLVSFGQIGDPDQFERAFAGATVHDMFNFLSVIVMLPIELIFHPLEIISDGLKPETVSKDDKWEGPIKQWVAPLASRIVMANKDVIKSVATGAETCDEIYVKSIADPDNEYGLIKCDDVYNPFTGKDTETCPWFYHAGNSRSDDLTSGGIVLVIAIVGLCACLIGLVWILQKMVLSSSTAAIKSATNVNPYLAMLIGCGVTILVQSSSITTSVLTPLVGLDVISLEAMFPLTLGANIGTTFTALLASLVSSKPEAVQIAYCHLMFNIAGILVWFPVPFMRQWPIRGAQALGTMTRTFRGTPAVYIGVMFVLLPLVFLGVAELFEAGGAFVVLGWFLVVVLTGGFVKMVWFFYRQDGWTKLIANLQARQDKADFYEKLPQTIKDMQEAIAGKK